MNPETKRWMLDKHCQPQTWQRAWDETRKMPEWDDLSEDYKLFIQIKLAYPGEASAREWWESRFQSEKREYFEMQDVNDDKKLGQAISNMIHLGDVTLLDKLVRENPQLNLSKFPGSWDDKKITPILLAATLGEMEVFMFLLKCKVNLEVVMRMPNMNFDTNLLSWLAMSPDNEDYSEYLNLLCLEPIEICVRAFHTREQPLFLFLSYIDGLSVQNTKGAAMALKNAESVLIRLIQIQLQKNEAWGAHMLMKIFSSYLTPTRFYVNNYLGKAMLELIELDIDFKIDDYDFEMLPKDLITKSIIEKLHNLERDRIKFLKNIFTDKQCMLSAVPEDLFPYFAHETRPAYLRNLTAA